MEAELEDEVPDELARRLVGEPIEASALGGLALILGGVALGSGTVGVRRRAPA